MGLVVQKVRIMDSTASKIKKRAFSEGTSASKIVKKVLEAAFDNPSGSGEGAGPGVEPESIRKIVEEALKPIAEKMDILVPDWKVTLSDMELELDRGLSVSESGPGLSPEIVRYLVETLGRLHSLSTKVLSHLPIPGVPDGEREDWLKMEPIEAQEVLKKLKIGGEE